MDEPLHTTRFPGETDEYRAPAMRCCGLRSSCAGAPRRSRRSDGLCRGAARCRSTTASRSRPATAGAATFGCPSCSRREGHAVPLQLHVPSRRRTAAGRGCPSCTSIVDSVDGAAPHVTQRMSLAVCREGPDRAIPGARGGAGLATHPPALLGRVDLQPRLRRRNVRRRAAPDRDCLRPPRRKDPPLLEQRTVPPGRSPGLHPRHVDYIWPAGPSSTPRPTAAATGTRDSNTARESTTRAGGAGFVPAAPPAHTPCATSIAIPAPGILV